MLKTISSNIHQRYQELAHKQFIGGLSGEEMAELARLEAILDEEEAPAYEPLKRSLLTILDTLKRKTE